MKILILSLVLLCVSASTVGLSWSGRYIVHSTDSQDTDCCFPQTYLDLTDATDATGAYEVIQGFWDYSPACDALSLSLEPINGKTSANDSVLTFNDTDIAMTIAKDGDSITITTGKNCTAPLTKANFTWAGTYTDFMSNNKTEDGCCFPKSLDITQNSNGYLQTTGVWEKTDSCKIPDLPDGLLKSHVPVWHNISDFNFINVGNVNSTGLLYLDLKMSQWDDDGFVSFSLSLNASVFHKSPCLGIASYKKNNVTLVW